MAFYAPSDNVENGKLRPSLQAPPLPFVCSPRAAFKKITGACYVRRLNPNTHTSLQEVIGVFFLLLFLHVLFF